MQIQTNGNVEVLAHEPKTSNSYSLDGISFGVTPK
jgi:hypothetical protein